MAAVFFASAAAGAAILVVQIVLSLVGADAATDGADPGIHAGSDLSEGLHLLSVRSLSAGAAFFGIGGLGSLSAGLPTAAAVAVALVTGSAALVGTAIILRQFLRLQTDGTINVSGALGSAGTVYLTIPAAREGPGKVHLTLQGRTTELGAVTTSDSPIPSGAPIVVVAVLDSETVEVLPASTIDEVLDANG